MTVAIYVALGGLLSAVFNEVLQSSDPYLKMLVPLIVTIPGFLGLSITAMIAGFMSGMAGNVSAFATVWTYDVYKPLLNKTASDAHYVRMGR